MPKLSNPCPSELKIRLLTEDDLPAADKLRATVGWNQTKADWSRLLAYEPLGCFAATWDESLVGTVTTTCYGTDLAWIGMVLVDSEYRGRGIGSALMRCALKFLHDSRVTCIQLDATSDGKPVYQKLGFRELRTFHRWKREANTTSATKSLDRSGFQFSSAQIELDRTAFGACRADWLLRVEADSVVIGHSGGYAMRRAGALATYLGPVTAEIPFQAQRLIESLLSDAPGLVIWDVPGSNPAAKTMATSLGFQRKRLLTRMILGQQQAPPNLGLQYAIADLATG